jgi:RNA polymerase sigma-70 factor (ECF subfamily)
VLLPGAPASAKGAFVMSASGAAVSLAMTGASGSTAETALVDRLRAGDPAAIGEVYDQHHEKVRAFARRLVGEDAAAEDLVHDVFVALPRVIGGFHGGASLRTFLGSVAINYARHHLRAAARRRVAMGRLAREPDGVSRNPEEAASSASLSRALMAAMDTLSLEHRVAFVLCEVEERTAREAGEIAGVPEATMRTRLFHARQRLRAELERRGIR